MAERPTLTMNQVIHAAVRRDLARLSDALAAAPDGDRARAEDLQRAWAQLRDQLRHHHEQEDTLLFPAFERVGIDAGLVATMESEHQVMVTSLERIDSAMTTYAASGSVGDAALARGEVDAGTTVVERHLAHEEDELEPLLGAHMGDPVVQEAMKAVRKQPPSRAGWFFAWLRDGASPEVLAALDATVPKPVQAVLSRVLGRGYHRQIAPVWR